MSFQQRKARLIIKNKTWTNYMAPKNRALLGHFLNLQIRYIHTQISMNTHTNVNSFRVICHWLLCSFCIFSFITRSYTFVLSVHLCVHACDCVCVCVCVSVGVCVCEYRWGLIGDPEATLAVVNVYVCVCLCVRAPVRASVGVTLRRTRGWAWMKACCGRFNVLSVTTTQYILVETVSAILVTI